VTAAIPELTGKVGEAAVKGPGDMVREPFHFLKTTVPVNSRNAMEAAIVAGIQNL
jgi:hypothetical protein